MFLQTCSNRSYFCIFVQAKGLMGVLDKLWDEEEETDMHRTPPRPYYSDVLLPTDTNDTMGRSQGTREGLEVEEEEAEEEVQVEQPKKKRRKTGPK